MRAATALVVRRFGRAPDHSNALEALLQRQDALVFKQHHPLSGNLAGQRVMRCLVKRLALGRLCRFVDDLEDAPNGFIQHRFIQRAIFHGLDDGLHPARLGAGHFQVEAALQSRHPVVDRPPVRNHQPLESPFFLQQVYQQPMMLGAIRPVELVVGAHHRPGFALFDGFLKTGQVDFAHRALADLGADREPLVFLIVQCKVLE